jgi:hypothetical protein
MATVINNPGDSNGAASAVITGVVVIVLVVLFFMYGLPRIRGTGGPTVNVPDHINVNTGGGQ